MYSIEKGEKDSHLKIKDLNSNLIFDHEGLKKPIYVCDSKFAIFTIKAWEDSIKVMKKNKVKKDMMPKDTIGIYNIEKIVFTNMEM